VIDFPRYLSAKKTIDDRAINGYVYRQLAAAFSTLKRDRPLRILEIGCGIGTMVERLLDWELAEQVDYVGIDAQTSNIQAAQTRLPAWGRDHGYAVWEGPSFIEISKGVQHWRIQFREADITAFWSEEKYQGYFDLQIAQAFLDLVDVPKALPNLARLVSPDGLFYFTINFDGGTIFEPAPDQAREAQIIECYHRSMDERLVDGQPSGDSRTGRHLFAHLQSTGTQILAAGASDWVVYPGVNGYPADEAYFLHCILDFFETTLVGRPDVDQDALKDWITARRRQIDRWELTYIAHQLDFLGRFSSNG
jgi:SAM-dependent methyltransferase